MGAILLSALCVFAGLFTLWPAAIVEILRDHTVLILVGLVLLGVAAEAALTAIKTAEARQTSAPGRTP